MEPIMSSLLKIIVLTILMFNFSFKTFASTLTLNNNINPVCENKSYQFLPDWLSNGKKLGKWWLRRSRDYEHTDDVLYHLNVRYNFDQSSGNEEVEKHKIKSSFTLRKNIFSNYLSYSLKKKEIEYRGSRINTEKQTFDNLVFIEALKFMDVLIGYQWITDDKKYYLNRFNYYGGFYFTLLNTKKFIFKIGGYYGHDTIEYMNELSELIGKQKEDFDKDFLYLNQRFNWLVTKNLTISEKFKYRSYTGESSYTLNAIIDLDFAITQNLSLNASYEIERDTTESENNIGIEDEDVDISLGIMINF
jgi:hypothetical protein